MCAAFIIAASLGIDEYTPLIGKFSVNNPMFLMRTVLANVMMCIGVFVAAVWVAKAVQAQTKPNTRSG